MSGIAPSGYPVRVEARLDEPSRFLWLFKWVLAIPHYIVLALLWAAFVVLSVAAFFAILFTGRYPLAIFEFNVGVLRWTWRVSYYAYGALASDRYPPFTLDEVPDYPAHLQIEYPERLSRGLVLIKWWLLALPHYVFVALFAGAAVLYGQEIIFAGGLITLLAIVAGLVLTFTATYPKPLFDVILGMNRWVLRVAAYAGLMTDTYPPFRFDAGGEDAGGLMTLAPREPKPEAPPTLPSAQQVHGKRWAGGRIIAVVLGSLLVIPSLAGAAAGGMLLGADLTLRDVNGFIDTRYATFTSAGHAIVTEVIALDEWPARAPIGLGTVRVRVDSASDAPLFVGIARAADVDRYLADVAHTVTPGLGDSVSDRFVSGSAVPAPPGEQSFWASAGGAGQSLEWEAVPGEWAVVAMNQDAGRGVALRASIGATLPGLRPFSIGMLVAGVLGALLGVVLIATALSRAHRQQWARIGSGAGAKPV